MAENSRPFDGGSYSSAQARAFFRRFLRDGVIHGIGADLKCTASGADLNVAVAAGEAMLDGGWYENTASQDVAMVPDVDNPRINRVVLQWTSATDAVNLALLSGVPAASPSAPALTWDANTKEMSLCQVYVAKGAATVAQSDITDERKMSQLPACYLTNKSGAALALGAVVVKDTTADKAFTTTTTARDIGVIGVVGEDDGIANNAAGWILTHGPAIVNLDAAATRGQFIRASGTAGKATPTSNPEIGVFGRVLETTAGAGLALCTLFGGPIAATGTGTAYSVAAYDSAGKLPAGNISAAGRVTFVWTIEGVQTTGTNKGVEYVAPFDCTLVGGYIKMKDAGPVGAALIVDINKGGTTVYTTQGNRPTVADGGGTTAVALSAPDVTAVSAGNVLTLDVDQVGSTTPGTFLQVYLYATYALA